MSPRRIAVPRPEDFRSRLRSPAVTARVGLWLGICFGVCFLTGLVSHAAQDTPGWLTFPTRPVSMYRVSQGLHVITGTAAVPLLLVKLWSVYPKLFERWDVGTARRLAAQGLERLSIAVLVSAATFQLATGLANAAQWYPWSFSFRSTHYAVAWIAVGALVVHIAVKLPVIRSALAGPLDEDIPTGEPAGSPVPPGGSPVPPGGSRVPPGDSQVAPAPAPAMSRRTLLRTTWTAAGVAVLTSAGATVPWLRDVSVFGVRSGDGPQGVPVNKSAAAAGVTDVATATDYRLTVSRGDRVVALTRGELADLPQVTARLPIACVEGWSATGEWTGVRVRDLVALVGAGPDEEVEVESLQESGPYRVTALPAQFVRDDLTLLALELDGEPLDLDHGYPCRVIAPNRPGVLQTKWVSSLRVAT